MPGGRRRTRDRRHRTGPWEETAVDTITDDERRTLLAERDLLDLVAGLAAVPGRLRRSVLDDALRRVDLPRTAPARRARLLLCPRTRSED